MYYDVDSIEVEERERYVVLLLDGICSEDLYSMVESSRLPNIGKLLEKGSYTRTCVSSFPSVTGPAHIPIFTGENPARKGISGHDQVLRLPGFKQSYLYDFTSYGKLNKEIEGMPTVYERFDEGVAVGEMVHKGAHFVPNYLSALAWFGIPFCGDAYAEYRTRKEYAGTRDFIATWITDTDAEQHIYGKHRIYRRSLKTFDRFLGRFMKGVDDHTTVVICSDHGMENVEKVVNLKRKLLCLGVRKGQFEITYDGGGFSQIYFKDGDGKFSERQTSCSLNQYPLDDDRRIDLLERLVEDTDIEFSITRDDCMNAMVYSRSGVGRISKAGDRYRYTVISGQDPFGYSGSPETEDLIDRWVTKDEILRASGRSEYPDAIYQVYEHLNSENAGDVIVTTSKGRSLSYLCRRGMHGGLRREQMVTMLMSSKKVFPDEQVFRSEGIAGLLRP